jgi:hypothetical protein
MSGAAGKNKEIVDVTTGEYFCLFAWHIEP